MIVSLVEMRAAKIKTLINRLADLFALIDLNKALKLPEETISEMARIIDTTRGLSSTCADEIVSAAVLINVFGFETKEVLRLFTFARATEVLYAIHQYRIERKMK